MKSPPQVAMSVTDPYLTAVGAPDRSVPPLILASTSPRRAELLARQGLIARCVPPPLPEPEWIAEKAPPERAAEALSFFKARSVACLVHDGLILAADTIVALEDAVFGKPAHQEDAKRILRALSGTTHKVITGLTLLDARMQRRLIRHDVTFVTMRSLSEHELEAYLESDAWVGKAGAYGIQDRGDAFVERITGSFSNVVGLPMELLAAMLETWK